MASVLSAGCSGNMFSNIVSGGGSLNGLSKKVSEIDVLHRAPIIDFEKLKELTSPENSRLYTYDTDEIADDIDYNIYEKIGIPLVDIDFDSEKQTMEAGVAAIQTYSTADFAAMALIMTDNDPTFGMDTEDYLVSDADILAESLQDYQINIDDDLASNSSDDEFSSVNDDALANSVFVPEDDLSTPEPVQFDDSIGDTQVEAAPEPETPVIANESEINSSSGDGIFVAQSADQTQSQSFSGDEFYQTILSQADQKYGFPQYQDPSTLSENPVRQGNAEIRYTEDSVSKTVTLADGNQVTLSISSEGNKSYYFNDKTGNHSFNLFQGRGPDGQEAYLYGGANGQAFRGGDYYNSNPNTRIFGILKTDTILAIESSNPGFVIVTILRDNKLVKMKCKGSTDNLTVGMNCRNEKGEEEIIEPKPEPEPEETENDTATPPARP